MFPRLAFLQHDNPIERAEYTHQRRSLKKRRRRFGRAICIVLLIVNMLALGYVLATGSQYQPYSSATLEQITAQTIANAASIVLLLTVFILHLLAIAQALNFAASSIAREKEARTWESLILTNADARRIVRGKWQAALRLVYRQYGYSLIVRVMTLGLLWLSIPFRAEISFVSYVAALMIGVLAMVAYTLLNVAFAGALGIIASTLNSRVGITITIARVFHLTIIFSMVGVLFLLLGRVMYVMSGAQLASYNVVVGTPLSVLDGGLTLGSTIMGTSDRSFDFLVAALGYVLFAVLLFAGLIWLVLRLSEYLLMRQNALAVNSQ